MMNWTIYISRILESVRRHNRLVRTMVPVLFVVGLVGWVFFWIGSHETDLGIQDRVGNIVHALAHIARMIFGRSD